MGSVYVLTAEDEPYDPVEALRAVVLEVTGYEAPKPEPRRIGFI